MPKQVNFIRKAVQNPAKSETKIIKIHRAILEIFNFKDRDLESFLRKNDRKTENVVV